MRDGLNAATNVPFLQRKIAAFQPDARRSDHGITRGRSLFFLCVLCASAAPPGTQFVAAGMAQVLRSALS
jgi:hypothetical protein